ncbi:hypothetical protein AB0B30_37360 [Streptomyces narbonensis]|uniref:Secreted protein n=1 Tax=Streptomyces narbonensis TaxID=67333 RepID=A0ABV3CM25_9ACTN
MNSLRMYFESNPDLFAAFIAALAIIGGLAGSLLGARIQASGGRDQAKAAREAAEIAAEAQRVAALWNVRQVQTAEFIQQVREVSRVVEQLYTQEITAELTAQVRDASQAMLLKQAEIELVASKAVIASADVLVKCVQDAVELAQRRGPSRHAQTLLNQLCFHEDRQVGSRALQVRTALDDLRSSYQAHGSDALMTGFYEVIEGGVTGLTEDHIRRLRYDMSEPELGPLRAAAVHDLSVKTTFLIEAARDMLRSNDEARPRRLSSVGD